MEHKATVWKVPEQNGIIGLFVQEEENIRVRRVAGLQGVTTKEIEHSLLLTRGWV